LFWQKTIELFQKARIFFVFSSPHITMSKAAAPDLRRYMDKKLSIKLNANRKVTGILRGFDQFMNLVLEDTIEEVSSTKHNDLGMVVIRGNSIILLEPLERA